MATIKKDKDGMFVVRATIGTREKNHEIRRKFKRQSEAKKFANNLELQVGRGGDMAGSNISLTEFFRQWITVYKLGKKSESTDKWYQTALGYVEEYFGARPMSSITKMQYQEFINYLGETDRKTIGHPLAKTTVSRVNHYIRTCIQDAIESGIINFDFTRKVEIVGMDGKPENEKFLSLTNLNKVLKLAMNGASMRHMADYIIITQALTGARYEEAVGLSWDRIDFDNKLIKFDRSWVYKKRIEFDNFGPLKNKPSYRTIPIPDKLVDVLKQLHQEQSELFDKTGYKDKNNLVFRNADHMIINNGAANSTLAGLCKRAKVGYKITTHGLRHTHGSILIYDGVELMSISKRLGHNDLQTTLETYAHEIDEMKTRDDEKIVKSLDKLAILK